ncbi:hypothetical protein ACFFHJ_01995 [Planotetraspora thailandica]|uniref:hypothetical protein n=1 Tax=Planotetraspora thailandica TaxID=487172 RepID=UPI0019503342|nr:hypothetical protein [Planotetraspora thailandica]
MQKFEDLAVTSLNADRDHAEVRWVGVSQGTLRFVIMHFSRRTAGTVTASSA